MRGSKAEERVNKLDTGSRLLASASAFASVFLKPEVRSLKPIGVFTGPEDLSR